MIISEEHEIGAEVMSLEVVWRNSLAPARYTSELSRQAILTIGGQNKP